MAEAIALGLECSEQKQQLRVMTTAASILQRSERGNGLDEGIPDLSQPTPDVVAEAARIGSLLLNDERQRGRPTTLTPVEEAALVQWILDCGLAGLPPTPAQVRAEAARVLASRPIPARFNTENGLPGDDWWLAFKNRHPAIVEKTPQRVKMRASMASRKHSELISDWMRLVNDVMTREGLHDKPGRILNADESQLAHNRKTTRRRGGSSVDMLSCTTQRTAT